MKKAICVMLMVVLAVMLCGCGRNVDKYFTESDRFIIVSGDNWNAPYYETVITDKETGVLYLVIYIKHQCGITPLLDRNGKPMLYSTQ